MTKIKESNRFGKLNEEQLSEFENQLQVTLPKDYRSFLLNHNGGCPVPDTNKTPETDVRQILGLHNGESWASLQDHIDDYKGRIPSDTLPIAYDSLGNLFLLSLRKDTHGEVWFWDHELEAANNASEYFQNITKSANSFREFIENLYDWIDPNEDKVDKIIRTNDLRALIELISSGYDINKTDEFGRTIIEYASIQNNLEMVKLLVRCGSELHKSLELAEQNQIAQQTDEYNELISYLNGVIRKENTSRRDSFLNE